MSKKKTVIYWIILAVILLGYTFFFTSRFFFHSEKTLVFTKLNTSVSMSDNVTLTLKKWTYSENDKAMMVVFDAQNTGLAKLDLNYSSMERHTTKMLNIETGTEQTKLSVDIIYPAENMVVVNLTNVPDNFEEVCLMLQVSNDINDTDLYDESLAAFESNESSEESESETKKSNSIISFYTNKEQVEKIEKIGDYTYSDYRIEYLKIQKSEKEQQIQDLESENEQLKIDNSKYQANIKTLIDNQNFETTAEMELSNNKINSFKTKISSNEKAIIDNNVKISELQAAIKELDDAIQKVQKDGDAQ